MDNKIIGILETVYGEFPGNESHGESNIETTSICFFDMRSIIHYESVPEGTIVNQTIYVEVLKRFIYAARRMRKELWRDRSLILQHANAPAYSSLRLSRFLAGKYISALDHPPYSPNLAPADFWL
jgi:histone-lysine N-methyltransferase SETMAR